MYPVCYMCLVWYTSVSHVPSVLHVPGMVHVSQVRAAPNLARGRGAFREVSIDRNIIYSGIYRGVLYGALYIGGGLLWVVVGGGRWQWMVVGGGGSRWSRTLLPGAKGDHFFFGSHTIVLLHHYLDKFVHKCKLRAPRRLAVKRA